MADEKITGGIRNTTSDGGSTTADVTIQNGAFSAASIGIVRPTGDGQQWAVSAEVNAANGVVNGGQVKFSLGATPGGEAKPTTTTQDYTLMDGTTRKIELPGFTTQYPDPGVNRTAVGVEVTGAQQQVLSTSVAGFDINASAAPRVGVAYGQNANGNTAFGLDAGADIASNLGNRQVGVQLMDTSKDGLSIKPYEREPTSNANLGKTFDALYEPTRPAPPPTPDQLAANLREDPAYKTALGSLQKQGYEMNPAPDGATDRLAAAIALEAKKNNLTHFDVAVGNTVFNSDGKTDRNLFLVSNELPAGKNVYTSETNALNSPVAEQAVKAQAQQALTPQTANPQQVLDNPLQTQEQQKPRTMQ
jgi:hypothetical protein